MSDVCVCVCVCVCLCVCTRMCVCEREREGGRKEGRERVCVYDGMSASNIAHLFPQISDTVYNSFAGEGRHATCA